jgi:hypothetical protein
MSIKKENKTDELEEKIKNAAEKKVLGNEFLEKVVKYIKTDDIIKEKNAEHSKEIKVIKETKNELEKYILKYLESKNQDYIMIPGKCELIKNETVTKGVVNDAIIIDSLQEEIKNNNYITDTNEQQKFINDILTLIDFKRPKKVKTVLKRKAEKKPKIKK